MALAQLGYTSSLAEYKMSQQQNILKRKKSFKRRRFTKYVACISMAIMCVMAQSINRVQAEPAVGGGYMRLYRDMVMRQQRAAQQQLGHQRYIRDVGASLSASLQQQQQQQQQHKENLKDSLQQSSSTEVTFEQPQGQCLLDGEYVPETTVFCEKQVGCRAIQKTGHCCPDYKCDCQKDGKTYLNGDKLVDPETPCTVCYCQGGEILCSSVTCFHRDDCTPKYIAGVCCPSYDNCPVVTSESSTNKTVAVITSTTAKPEIHQAENNPKITIKEITKPIEIRITNDNKAISIQQMLKPSTTSTTSTTTSATTNTTSPTPPARPAISTQIPHTDAINAKRNTNINHSQLKEESFQAFSEDSNQVNKNCKNTVKGSGISSGEILKLSASVAYPSTALMASAAANSSTHAPLDSSVEVEDPVPALSVFSTQGLPQDPSKVNIKREYFVTTEGVVASGSAVFDGFESGEYQQNSDLLFSQSGQVQNAASSNALQQTSAELDPDTAGSDNIYHIILTTDGPRLTATSENYLALKGISTTVGLPFDDLSASSMKPIESNINKDPNAEQPLKHDSATESAMHQHLDEDDSAIPLESNPAYPSLPEDDFSLRDNNFQINDVDDLADEPRSISGTPDAIKSTKHLDDQTYGGSGSGMLLDDLASLSAATTESSGDLVQPMQQSTPDSRERNRTQQAIDFLYSAEDFSAETKITNSSDFKIKKAAIPVDLTSFEASEFGSGSEEIKSAKQQKEREPTTARPNKNSADIDIDEIYDASGHGPADDPKLDAESLKLDETAADSTINSDKSAKNNILSVKVQPAQNKNFHDNFH